MYSSSLMWKGCFGGAATKETTMVLPQRDHHFGGPAVMPCVDGVEWPLPDAGCLWCGFDICCFCQFYFPLTEFIPACCSALTFFNHTDTKLWRKFERKEWCANTSRGVSGKSCQVAFKARCLFLFALFQSAALIYLNCSDLDSKCNTVLCSGMHRLNMNTTVTPYGRVTY